MFQLVRKLYIAAHGGGLNRSTITRGDTVLVKGRIHGDTTGATVKFTARYRDVPGNAIVISKVSTTPSQIKVDPLGDGFQSDITIQISDADTASLEPGTTLEYDLQIEDAVSYGGSSGGEVTIANAVTTLTTAYPLPIFTVMDGVTI